LVSNLFVRPLLLALIRLTRCIDKRLISVLLTALFLCSCAKDNPLSDSQKDQILETMQSAGRAYNAARANINASATHKSIDLTDPILRQMVIAVRDRIKARDCRIRIVTPSSYRTDSSQSVKRTFMVLLVWGKEDCPINLDFKITTLLEPSLGRWAVSYDYSYLVTDSSYRKFNDVDAIELHGGISINGMNTGHIRSEIDMKGTIHSLASGTVGVESSGELEGANTDVLSGESLWKFNYTDFVAEFRRKYDNGQLSFSINHEDVSSDDFSKYFTSGGDPFTYGSDSSLVH